MPTLRIYLDAHFDNDLSKIEEKLFLNPDNFAHFDKNDEITHSGFYSMDGRIFHEIENTGYHVANYFRKETKIYPSKNSELSYFKLLEEGRNEQDRVYTYPMLIKLIFNKQKGILCFYSKKILKNEAANEIIERLQKIDAFSFKYSLYHNHHKFKKNTLDDFLLSLSDSNNFTQIGIYDEDNKLIAKNENILQETEKIAEFQKEVKKGNWEHVQLVNEALDFEIRLSNRKTQHFLTFINDYKNDAHLIYCVDYLISKIRKTIEFEKQKQTSLIWFGKRDN